MKKVIFLPLSFIKSVHLGLQACQSLFPFLQFIYIKTDEDVV